jgi:hypothetical protein
MKRGASVYTYLLTLITVRAAWCTNRQALNLNQFTGAGKTNTPSRRRVGARVIGARTHTHTLSAILQRELSVQCNEQATLSPGANNNKYNWACLRLIVSDANLCTSDAQTHLITSYCNYHHYPQAAAGSLLDLCVVTQPRLTPNFYIHFAIKMEIIYWFIKVLCKHISAAHWQPELAWLYFPSIYENNVIQH